MDPVAVAVEKVKGAVKSSRDFVTGVYRHRRANIARRDPIEILKRLQREAFSDLMKLRDRQDKVERVIAYYNKSSKGNPFQEASTRVRGEVDIVGALLCMNKIDQPDEYVLDRTGVLNGINSRFTFETIVRQKDTVRTELVASHKDAGFPSHGIGSPLSLSKVSYAAQITDWLSTNVLPVGAQCRDIGNATDFTDQGKSFWDITSTEPPLLIQNCGSGIGVTANISRVTASLAQFVGVEKFLRPVTFRHCLGTFGRLAYQISNGTKVSLSGLLQVPKTSQHICVGPFTIPLGSYQHTETPPTSMEPVSSLLTGTETESNFSLGSVALSLESQLDECSRIGGWIQMHNSSPKQIQWNVSLSDSPENEMGWGLHIGGTSEGHKVWDQLQIEALLKFNVGESKKISLQPSLIYMKNGTSLLPAIVLRSHCSL